MLSLILAAITCAHVNAPFFGTVCSPNDGKKHAAVVILGGSEGGDSLGGVASDVARHGFVAASVAYFGAPGMPQTLVSVPVETVERALGVLRARHDVRVDKIGIFGISKGGELALLAASTYPQIKAVVAIVPAPFAFMGLGKNDVEGCSWSKNGRDLPCIQPDGVAGMQVGLAIASGKPVAFTPFYEASRKDNADVTAAATFPLQNIRGPVLCLAGGGDQVWDSTAYCDITSQYLSAHHHPFADRTIDYPGAGHLFLYATHGPSSAIATTKLGNAVVLFGGTPEADARAATDAWKTIWSFLAVALR
jgi:dienelactone hydrolase